MNDKLDKYKKVISKDDLSSLDLGRYQGEIILVDTEHALNEACEEIANCFIIGIDTETKPSFKKGVVNSVALLQIATDKRVFIIRLKLVKMSSELASIFSNKNIIKVGIAVRDDLKDLKKFIHLMKKVL